MSSLARARKLRTPASVRSGCYGEEGELAAQILVVADAACLSDQGFPVVVERFDAAHRGSVLAEREYLRQVVAQRIVRST